jgi:PAS domain S-box-containing protein
MLNSLYDNSPYLLHPLAVQALVVAFGVSLLGIYVLIREQGSRVSVSYFLLTQSMGVWLFAFSRMYSATDEHLAMWWVRVGYAGIAVIPASVYYFVTLILKQYERVRMRVFVAWLVSACFLTLFLTTDIQVASLYHYSWGYYPRSTITSIPFILFFFGIMLVAFRSFVAAYRGAAKGSTQKMRAGILLISVAAGYFGAADFVPSFGVPWYPLGYLGIFCLTVVATRSILRYRFMPITVAFASHQIIATMNDALIVLDSDGNVNFVNEATCRLFDYHEVDFVGKRLTAGMVEDAAFAAQFESVIRSGTAHNREVRYRPKEGAIRTLAVSTSIMRNPMGEPLATVCVLRDITERTQAEEEREKLVKGLQKALAEIKTLHGFLPICYSCKKVRDDTGYWKEVEHYIGEHSEIEFSHGLCPECGIKRTQEIIDYKKKREKDQE